MNAPLPGSAQCVSLAEIAYSLGVTKQAVSQRSIKESWPFEEMVVRGGKKRLYRLASLPKPIRDALQRHQLRQAAEALGSSLPSTADQVRLPATAKANPLAVAAEDLDSHQRTVDRARKTLIDLVEGFNGPRSAALRWINEEARQGTLPANVAAALANAKDKASGVAMKGDALPRDTYNKWLARYRRHGTVAPLKSAAPDMSVKPWHGLAIALRQRPQGGTITWIHEQLEDAWDAAWGPFISYDTLCDFFRNKLAVIDQLKGRHTGSALSAHLHYTRRSSAGLNPWDEIHADGWNTHFTAPHPVTGEFVTYEVWHYHDVATRYVCPYGIGLTENFEVIAKGLENCIREGGVMLILQTDSTKVVKGSERFQGNVVTALEERLGTTIRHPVKVGNSQANGICENYNTWLDRESRELATYQGKGMDSLTLKRVKKLTEKMVKAERAGDLALRSQLLKETTRAGKGLVLDSYESALAWLEDKRQKYNNRPHSSLPKVTDPATGRRRHQTPAEALQAARNNGWQPVALTEAELIETFRPHVIKTVTRGTVTPYGGMRYRHETLDAWLGKPVVVAFDIMDWRQVWVKTTQGQLICVAEYDGTTGYRAKSAYEDASEKRAKAQIARRERQISTIAERHGLAADAGAAPFIDGQARRLDEPKPVEMEIPSILAEAALAEAEAATQQQPVVGNVLDMALWLHGDEIDASQDGTQKEVAAG